MPVPAAYSRFARLLALRDRLAELVARARGPRRTRLGVEGLEDRVVPAGRPLPYPVIYAGTGEGPPPVVRAFDAVTGVLTFERLVADPGFTGGVRVATADFTADGFPDVVTALGPGGPPVVKVLDGKTGDPVPGPLGDLTAYVPWFRGGVSVAAAEVDGDGIPDLITAAGAGGGPHVRVFSGVDGRQLASFFAFEPDFAGGVSIAAADFTGDTRADLVVGAGPGGGPRVRVFDLTTGRPAPGPLGDFFAFDPASRTGVSVGADGKAGDVDADGRPDLVVGSGPGAADRVRVFSGATRALLGDFAPFGGADTAGVRVALAFADDDEFADVVAATGPGRTPAEVRVFRGATGQPVALPTASFFPFGPNAGGGVNLAATNDPIVPGMTTPTINPSSPQAGATTTFGVTLSPAAGQPAPTGTVTFTATPAMGGAPVTLGSPVTLVPAGGAAQATLTAPAPAAGAYVVSAAYGGDAVYATQTTSGWMMVSGATSPPPPPPPPNAPPPPPPPPGIYIEADTDAVVRGEPLWFTLTSDEEVPEYDQIEWDFDYLDGTFTTDAAGPDPWAEATLAAAGVRMVAARLTPTGGGAAAVYTLEVDVRYPAPVVTVPEEPVWTIATMPTPLDISVTSERPIVGFEWYVSFEGDVPWLDPTVTAAPEFYVFPWYGDWDVWVVATDADGNVGEGWFTVTADDFNPVGQVDPVPTVAEGTPSVFTLRATLPDERDTLTVYADWGEGRGVEQVNPDGFTVGPDGALTFPHTYAKDGTYAAAIRVENDGGVYADVAATAVVTDLWPSWAVNAGTQIAHRATSNQDVWALRPGQTLLFDDVRTAGRQVWLRPDVSPNPPTPGVAYPPLNAPPPVVAGPVMTDTLNVSYHWIVSLDPSSHVAGEMPAGALLDQEVVTKTPFLSLPFYRAGVIYQVQAWVTDDADLLPRPRPEAAEAPPGVAPADPPPPAPPVVPGAAAQARSYFTVVVDDPAGYANVGTPGPTQTTGTSGSTWLQDKVYGTLSVINPADGELVYNPDVYARYAMYINLPETSNVAAGGPMMVRFELDAATRQWLLPDVTVEYRFTELVYQVVRPTFGSDSLQLLPDESHFYSHTGQPGTWGFTKLFDGVPADRYVLIQASADLKRNGQVWRTTSQFDFERTAQSNFAQASTMYQPRAAFRTMTPPSLGDQAQALWDALAALRDLARQFGERVNALADSLTSYGAVVNVIGNLRDGFVAALDKLKDDLSKEGVLLEKLARAILGPSFTIPPALQNPGNWTWSNLLPVMLDYAGLTWEHVYQVAQRELGVGNLAALETVAGWFEGLDPAAPGGTGLNTLLDRVKATAAANGLNPDALWGDLQDAVMKAVQKKVEQAMMRAAVQAAAKFVPGAGALLSLGNALSWMLANKDSLMGTVGSILDALAAAATPGNSAAVRDKLYEAFDQGMAAALQFAATQLGVGNLGTNIRKALDFVPARVDAAFVKVLAAVAAAVPAVPPGGGAPPGGPARGGTVGGRYDGRMAAAVVLTVDVTTYHLWAAQETGKTVGARVVKIKVGRADGTGPVLTLDPKMFVGTEAVGRLTAAVNAAKALQTQMKPVPGVKPTGATMPALQVAQQAVVTALTQVKASIEAYACTALGTGCFAAGTKLLTRTGWRAVEDIRHGDELLARSEFDPAGPAEWKTVEETFRRTDLVAHLHVGGELVRTTPEHPFFVAGKGWTAAGALRSGDQVATLSGEWVTVEEVFDTGVYEPVYNLRVADHHTYFVGDDGWGYALWAHNAYAVPTVVQTAVNLVLPGSGTQPTAVIEMGINSRRGDWRVQARSQGLTNRDSLVYVVRDVTSGELLKVGESGRGYERFEPYLTQARTENRDIQIFAWRVPGESTQTHRRRGYERPIQKNLQANNQTLLWEANARVFRLKLDATQPEVTLSLQNQGTGGWKQEGRDRGLSDSEPLVYIVRDATSQAVLKVGETANWAVRFEQYATRARREARSVQVEIWRLNGQPHSGSDRTTYWEAPLANYFIRNGSDLQWDEAEIGRNPAAIVIDW